MYGWLGMCAPIKLNFPFCKRKPLFDALSNVYQTDVGLSDVFVVTLIARNRINGVGSFFLVTGSLGSAKICPKI